MSFVATLQSTLLLAWFRTKGIELGKHCLLAGRCQLHRGRREGARGSILLGDACVLETRVQLQAWGGRIQLADRVQLGERSVIHGQGGVSIGEDSRIGNDCLLLSAHRALPASFQANPGESEGLRPTRLGRNVRLESGVIVLGGVSIGDGCQVRPGSIVANDLPPGSIASGIPARPLPSLP